MTGIGVGDGGFYNQIIPPFCKGSTVQDRIRYGRERKVRDIGIDIEIVTTTNRSDILHIIIGRNRPGIVV